MSTQNNIFNKEFRINFLKKADSNTLNDYLKNLEKLSKKGGKYLEIYNDDLFFLNEMIDNSTDDIFNSGGGVFQMMTNQKTKPQKNNNDNVEYSEVQNTETRVNKINHIIQKNSRY